MSKELWAEEEQEPELIGSYEILHPIGRGSFGDVKCAKKGFSHNDNDLFALKICSRSQLKKIKMCEYDLSGALLRYTGVQRFEKECAILESLRHPNIVQFCEVFHDEEEDLLVLVTAFCPLGPVLRFDGDSQRYVYNPALVALHKWVFEVEDVRGYFRDIVQAVAHLHKNNICHRDIKPANILLAHNPQFPYYAPHATAQTAHSAQSAHTTRTAYDATIDTQSARTVHSVRPYRLILCDFGAADQFHPDINPAGLVSNTTGSPADWAPEAVFPEKYNIDVGLDLASEIPENVIQDRNDTKSDSEINESEHVDVPTVPRYSAYGLDMWALGVLLYELFYLRHPFYSADLSEVELYQRIDSLDPLLYTTHDMCTVSTEHNSKEGVTVSVYPPDAECTNIMEGLLQKEPTTRWSVGTLFDVVDGHRAKN